MDKKYFFAIHCGHNASCALMKEGEIIAAAQEERFSRIKNDSGYPKQAIDYCLKKTGVKGSSFCSVAYTTRDMPGVFSKAKNNINFSLKDYMDYYGEKYYIRQLKGEDCLDYLKWIRDDEKFNKGKRYFDFSFLTDEVLKDKSKSDALFRKESIRILSTHLNISPDKVEFLDHHTSHAYYAYFGSPFRKSDCIVITLDGWGDGRNQTVWKASEDKLELIAETDQNAIGHIYRMATLILGMRPVEHEYKVMGLAPYAKNSYVRPSYEVIKDILRVDGMRIVNKNRPKDLFTFLKKGWEGHRFDNIAAAVQLYTENLVKELIENIYCQTGIKRFVLSGGISMNVKMNKVIAGLPCVSSLFVCASGADESLSMGGCYYLNRNNNKPLKNMYLGYDINDEFNFVNWKSISKDYKVNSGVSYADPARLLAKGDIVAVICGRAEFGARALGNRSILANPSNIDAVKKINEAIKNRDFWMPFALSILEEYADEYIENRKKLKAPFMTLAFDTLPRFYSKIHAGTHPYDKTVRPQFVSKKDTPDFYGLIEKFYKLTGIPALLNTSFNLHGEPIVNNISDALRTFKLSDLDHLLINNTLVSKKE